MQWVLNSESPDDRRVKGQIRALNRLYMISPKSVEFIAEFNFCERRRRSMRHDDAWFGCGTHSTV